MPHLKFFASLFILASYRHNRFHALFQTIAWLVRDVSVVDVNEKHLLKGSTVRS
jgi:hypothetical protein